jgi:hypothetical protein
MMHRVLWIGLPSLAAAVSGPHATSPGRATEGATSSFEMVEVAPSGGRANFRLVLSIDRVQPRTAPPTLTIEVRNLTTETVWIWDVAASTSVVVRAKRVSYFRRPPRPPHAQGESPALVESMLAPGDNARFEFHIDHLWRHAGEPPRLQRIEQAMPAGAYRVDVDTLLFARTAQARKRHLYQAKDLELRLE